MSNKENNKLEYSAPKLIRYGDVRNITQAVTNNVNAFFDGASAGPNKTS
ncbi:MAG: lasso RiPP family leader peptide-containing protein [Planctomycetaceae bacterium]|nr:lasso RiPP family leader peptide-containing protein [Planctomycetaceae bacterium]